jgi:hypothetical protein
MQELPRDLPTNPTLKMPFTNGHETTVAVTSVPKEQQQIAQIDFHVSFLF